MRYIFVYPKQFHALKKGIYLRSSDSRDLCKISVTSFCTFFVKSGDRPILPAASAFFLQSELDAFAEHLLDLLFQYRMLRCRERRIPLNDLFRCEAHFFEDIRIFDQIADV